MGMHELRNARNAKGWKSSSIMQSKKDRPEKMNHTKAGDGLFPPKDRFRPFTVYPLTGPTGSAESGLCPDCVDAEATEPQSDEMDGTPIAADTNQKGK